MSGCKQIIAERPDRGQKERFGNWPRINRGQDKGVPNLEQ
jgi:hypothetical protein